MDLQLRHRLPAGVGGLWRRLAASVTIDTRSLAVFRIAMALLLIADVLLRLRNFDVLYVESGVVSQSVATARTPDAAVSVFYLTTDPTITLGLFLSGILIGLFLLVGYRTRLATVLAFLFAISLDHHNPLVTSYADVLFRLLLFWAMFLPLGERWSVDALHRQRLSEPVVRSVVSALILCQIVVMYFVNWQHKSENELWASGEATPLIMGLDDTTFLLGEFTRNFPTLLQYGGLTWYYMLAFSWLLILLAGRKRMAFVSMFMSGHASFAVTVRIGAFAYVAIAGLSLFLQAQFWADLDRIRRRLGIDRARLTSISARFERHGRRVPYPHLEHRRAAHLRSGVYTLAVAVLVGALLILFAGMYLPVGGDAVASSTATEQLKDGAAALAITQPSWSVFAPTPRTLDGYYVFAAKTTDGELVDVYNDRELTAARPGNDLHTQYGSYRERFYMNSIRRDASTNRHAAPALLAEHHCEAWASEHDTELTKITMHRITERVTLDTIDHHGERSTQTQELFTHPCGDHDDTSPIELPN